MKRKLVIGLATIVCFTMVGCGKEIKMNEPNETKEKIPVEEANEILDGSTYKRDYDLVMNIAECASSEGNTILSPTSLDYALGMVAMGANGATKDAFEEYFGCDLENASMRHLGLSSVWENDGNVEVLVSNTIACDENSPLLDEYKQKVGDAYDAEIVDTYNFHEESEEVASYLNDFCNKSTKGMIPQIVTSDIVRDKASIFVNALYFNGKWEEPFAEFQLQEEPFSNGDGSQNNVAMMYGNDSVYFEGGNATGFSKPYAGGNFEFVGILPDASVCDGNGNFHFTDIDLEAFLNSRTSKYDVNYKMPKFKVECDLSLANACMQNGLEQVFGADADFSKMSDSPFSISEVIQKVVVDVNEEGTEASAVTSIMMTNTSIGNEKETKVVNLDRPFLFLIYDRTNDEVLFVGRISSL